MKKVFIGFLVVVLLLTNTNIDIFANTQGKIANVDIEVKDDDIILKGETTGNTDGMTVNISLMDMEQKIQYFDQLTIRGNKFTLTLQPMTSVKDDRLMLKISGDLIYTKEFVYAKESSFEQETSTLNMEKLKQLLNQKYKTYTDYSGNLNFEYSVEEVRQGEYIIKMKGTNFSKSDSSWTAKQAKRFDTFLQMIGDEAYIIRGVKDVDQGSVRKEVASKD